MKNQPYSVTGKFVEDLKATKQNSAKDNNIYSQYIPKYIQKNWKSLFSKQLYGIGKDILYDNNLLLQYGFTKQRPPVPDQGSSQYSLTVQNDQIILWGFGMIFATGNNGLFLWRHAFEPKLLDASLLPSNVWMPDQLPQLTVPHTFDEKHLMLQLLVKATKWLERYENWILTTCGESYRSKSLQTQNSYKISFVCLEERWSELHTKFEKILKKHELKQNSNMPKSEPLQPDLDRLSTTPKNTCGACGDSYPEDLQFCPSCNWEALPC